MTRLPSLGPRGEGWVVDPGRPARARRSRPALAGPGLAGGPAAAARRVAGGVLLVAGGPALAVRGPRRPARGPHAAPPPAGRRRARRDRRLRPRPPPDLRRARRRRGRAGRLLTASPAALAGAGVLLAFFELKSRREEAWLASALPGVRAYARAHAADHPAGTARSDRSRRAGSSRSSRSIASRNGSVTSRRQRVADRVLGAVGGARPQRRRAAGRRARRRGGGPAAARGRRPSASAPRPRAASSSRSRGARGDQGRLVDGRALVAGGRRLAARASPSAGRHGPVRVPSSARRRPAARTSTSAQALALRAVDQDPERVVAGRRERQVPEVDREGQDRVAPVGLAARRRGCPSRRPPRRRRDRAGRSAARARARSRAR